MKDIPKPYLFKCPKCGSGDFYAADRSVMSVLHKNSELESLFVKYICRDCGEVTSRAGYKNTGFSRPEVEKARRRAGIFLGLGALGVILIIPIMILILYALLLLLDTFL